MFGPMRFRRVSDAIGVKELNVQKSGDDLLISGYLR